MIGRWRVPGGSAGPALLVLALLPFEPRRPRVSFLGLEFTLLEMAVGLALLALLLSGRNRLVGALRHPPAPVAALAAFAAAHLLSAAWATAHRDLALKFALRMVAAAVFAFAVSLAPAEARRRGLLALVVGATAVAVLAVLEWYPVRGLRPFLDLFRESWVVVGSTRRVTAGSEYPNLAAVFLVYGLVAAAALVPDPRRGLASAGRSPLGGRAAFLLFPILSLGLVLTYSRGALVAAAFGLLTVAFARRSGAGLVVPASAMAVLAVTLVGVSWFEPALRIRLSSPGTEGWYSARYELPETSRRLSPRQHAQVVVRVVNTGRDTWTTTRSFSLGHRWRPVHEGKDVAESFGIPLGQDVPPGGTAVVTVDIEAPPVAGRYALTFDVVQGHLGWLSGLGSPAGTLEVDVGTSLQPPTSAPARHDPPRVEPAWRPGRKELARLALAMWTSRPLLGVGSDNFRWLHGAFAGRSDFDPRTFSNNTLLEVASTTGGFGLFAFLATMACALVSAYRSATSPAVPSAARSLGIAVLGLLVAVAVHGLADYVLAFTGQYAAFAFLIGVATPDGGERAATGHA